MHQVAVEDEEVAGLHQHRHRRRHVVVDDLDVAVVRVRPPVVDVLVDRLIVRAGQHLQATVLERRFGDGEPYAGDGPRRIEREVEGVLVPGLPPRARVLEDELAEEAVQVRADEIDEQIGDARVACECGEDRVAVELEDLRDELFGLAFVPTNLWGGLLVTLVVALTGIALSFPLGILLALGRQSKMPAVRLLSVIFIEFWRGVPLITVLFMATFMLPLFLPSGVSLNQLLRVLVGVSLFAAAYMAEVIRGGLQAIPKGQYEGADAMALTYWQKMRMIILPQALTLVIPGIVNTFIGLFKDTSLVSIIGLADLLGAVRRGFSDPAWITPTTPATGLVFAAFSFWLFCFGMSRYSIFMERRLSRGHKH